MKQENSQPVKQHKKKERICGQETSGRPCLCCGRLYGIDPFSMFGAVFQKYRDDL